MQKVLIQKATYCMSNYNARKSGRVAATLYTGHSEMRDMITRLTSDKEEERTVHEKKKSYMTFPEGTGTYTVRILKNTNTATTEDIFARDYPAQYIIPDIDLDYDRERNYYTRRVNYGVPATGLVQLNGANANQNTYAYRPIAERQQTYTEYYRRYITDCAVARAREAIQLQEDRDILNAIDQAV